MISVIPIIIKAAKGVYGMKSMLYLLSFLFLSLYQTGSAQTNEILGIGWKPPECSSLNPALLKALMKTFESSRWLRNLAFLSFSKVMRYFFVAVIAFFESFFPAPEAGFQLLYSTGSTPL